jgi:hypothetical protein
MSGHHGKGTCGRHHASQYGVGGDPSEMIQQLGDKDASFFEIEAKRNHQRSAHADAVPEAHRKTGRKI